MRTETTRDAIVAGGGRVGFQTAELLADRNESVTIVEQTGDRVAATVAAWMSAGSRVEGQTETLSETLSERRRVVSDVQHTSPLQFLLCRPDR